MCVICNPFKWSLEVGWFITTISNSSLLLFIMMPNISSLIWLGPSASSEHRTNFGGSLHMLGCKRNLVPSPRLLTTLVSINIFLLFCRAVISNSNTSPPSPPSPLPFLPPSSSSFLFLSPSLSPPLLLFPHFPLWYSESVFFFSSRVRIKSINISTDISFRNWAVLGAKKMPICSLFSIVQ